MDDDEGGSLEPAPGQGAVQRYEDLATVAAYAQVVAVDGTEVIDRCAARAIAEFAREHSVEKSDYLLLAAACQVDLDQLGAVRVGTPLASHVVEESTRGVETEGGGLAEKRREWRDRF